MFHISGCCRKGAINRAGAGGSAGAAGPALFIFRPVIFRAKACLQGCSAGILTFRPAASCVNSSLPVWPSRLTLSILPSGALPAAREPMTACSPGQVKAMA